MATFETWTTEEVSEWLVENGLPADVARASEGTAFHHLYFVAVSKVYLNEFLYISHKETIYFELVFVKYR